MFGEFTEEARKILVSAKEEMYELKHPYVGSEHLLLAILKDNNAVSKKLKEYNLTYDVLKNEIISIIGTGSEYPEWFLYTPLLKRIIENAILDCKDDDSIVTVDKLFISLDAITLIDILLLMFCFLPFSKSLYCIFCFVIYFII